ncbi:MAG: transglycosylase SLT domain-containing protein [Muribaculaceae bacterium]|nr:transglycosylase SLT domain-containing protein [Muribaculaceae bacterium]
MKPLLLSFLASVGITASAWAVPSILDIRYSISDDNIIAPESFETQTRLLEENFYLKNFVVPGIDTGTTGQTSSATYQERLKRLPTEIELPYNSIVGNYIDMYLGRKRGLVADMVALHNYYGVIFEEELLKEGMPVELEYLPVIESAINPNAVSRAGAVGLWQFMPATAKGLGMEVNSLVDERRDPRMSSRNAARYLKQLHDIYDDWSLAIAAYNCGPGNVNKALRRAGGEDGTVKKDFWEIYPYLPAETRGYVPAFIAANYVMNHYRDHGITPTIVKRQLTTDTVTVDKYVHFNQIAAVLNIPVEEIRMLNPQFLKDVIPGDFRPYKLTLPTQQCLSYVMSENRILDYDKELYTRRSYVEPAGSGSEAVAEVIPSDGGTANLNRRSQQSVNNEVNNELVETHDTTRVVKKTHTVKRGENIRDIARMYGVSATDIKRWNNLRRGKVKEGDVLAIEVVERIPNSDVHVVEVQPIPPVTGQPQNETAQTDTNQPEQAANASSQSAAKKETEPARQNKSQTKGTQTRTHKVKKGDTLGKLARQYGTTVAAIQAANNMKGKTDIQIGQVLKIPAKGGVKATATKSGKKKTTSRKRRR